MGDTRAFLLKTWVDEADVRSITPDQAAVVSLTSDPTYEFQGKVLRVSSQARAKDRGQDGQVRVEFEVQVRIEPQEHDSAGGPAPSLRVGASASVRLDPPDDDAAALVVPLAALVWTRQGQPAVLVRKSPDERESLRLIEVARTTADGVELRSGVEEGEEVWVPVTQEEGAAGMSDRMAVSLASDHVDK